MLNAGEDCDMFSVKVVYNGFFCGLRNYLSYSDASVAHVDRLTTDSWSIRSIDEILSSVGCNRDGRLHVYWCLPEKDLRTGLVLVEKDAEIREMAKASRKEKTLVLYIDHTNFLGQLREDVIITRPPMPRVISPTKIARAAASADPEASSSSSIGQLLEKDCAATYVSESDSDTEYELYDSDFDVEDGDDDLFSDNIDKSLNDHNEKDVCVQHEDEDALEDDDLNLGEQKMVRLKKKW
jgi:hypothetical protein